MMQPFIQSIRLSGLLSYPPDAEAIELTPLNVLIGPNASGKSNLIEAIELLHATPTKFADAIRDGGGVREWLWKGEQQQQPATIETIVTGDHRMSIPDLRYKLTFVASSQRVEIIDEVIEEPQKRHDDADDVYFYYRYDGGRPYINTFQSTTPPPDGGSSTLNRVQRRLTRDSLIPDESVLSQRKDPELYPELTWLGRQHQKFLTFREWNFGRYGALRQPQPTDLPNDVLLPDSRNLAMILNAIEHSDAGLEFNRLLSRFLPRYHRFSTSLQGGTVQLNLHESGLKTPVPATRLSDGTLRFMAILGLLLSPTLPPLICIEEPELGLHPDAVCILAELLESASERTQLIVSTHSDTLVSALTEDANSVLVCEYRGGTQLSRIDPEKLEHWLDQYQLGEIWRMGELGGNP